MRSPTKRCVISNGMAAQLACDTAFAATRSSREPTCATPIISSLAEQPPVFADVLLDGLCGVAGHVFEVMSKPAAPSERQLKASGVTDRLGCQQGEQRGWRI
jgi:hypothetical protein